MSGHSKWANIKRRKQSVDSKRGNIFTKLSIAIATAVKSGGDNPDTNWKLKTAIENAKSENMPNDNIFRIIKKASGNSADSNYEEIIYEGYGPSGVAIIVETMTNNKNRTAGDLRHLFDKFGGNLGTTGCVSFTFDKKGIFIIDKESICNITQDQLMEYSIEGDAEDFNAYDEYYEIITAPEKFHNMYAILESKKCLFLTADVQMIPNTFVKIDNPQHKESLEKLLDKLDELDDVQYVYHNWEKE